MRISKSFASDLGQKLNAFHSETFENERHGLNDERVLVRQIDVLENFHQRRNGDGGVEIFERSAGHVDEHLRHRVA